MAMKQIEANAKKAWPKVLAKPITPFGGIRRLRLSLARSRPSKKSNSGMQLVDSFKAVIDFGCG
jgi:hypothetical protein